MGNTPSQGGIQHPNPGEQVRGHLQGIHGHDGNSHTNQGNQQSLEANFGNIGRERPMSADSIVEQKVNGNRNGKNTKLSSNGSSVPLHFGRDYINNGTEPYSMDSLAVDTSSISSVNLSPSSLSPITLCEEPLGHLTVSTDKFHQNKHKNLSSLQALNKYLDHINPIEQAQFGDSMLTQFDSLEEPALSVDDISQSSPSSSFFNPNELGSGPVETGLDIVTVNGLSVPSDYSEMFPKCVKKAENVAKVSNRPTEAFTIENKSIMEDSLVINGSKNSINSNSVVSIPAEKETPFKTILPENTSKSTLNNKRDVPSSDIIDVTKPTMTEIVSMDNNKALDYTLPDQGDKPEPIYSEVHTMEFFSETESENELGFHEGRLNSDSKPSNKNKYNKKSDNDSRTVRVLSGNDLVSKASEEDKLSNGCEPVNTDRQLGPVDFKIDRVPECIQRNENQFDETVVVSNLIFIDGSNNEDGEVFTQVCLEPSEMYSNISKVQKQAPCRETKQNSETILGSKSEAMYADKVFQNDAFPNYYMGNKDKSNGMEHEKTASEEKSGCVDPNKPNVEAIPQSKILTLVSSGNRLQFPDSQSKIEIHTLSVEQELCESWDEIQHNNLEEIPDRILPMKEFNIQNDLNSVSKIIPPSESEDSKNFNPTVHRESLADFERLEAEISKLEGLHFLKQSSSPSEEANAFSTELENKYSPTDNQSLCTNDSNKSSSLETLKEGPDYEEFATKEAGRDKEMHENDILERNYSKLQNMEIREECINFHKEAQSDNIPNAIDMLPLELVLPESLLPPTYSGVTGQTNPKVDGHDINASGYLKQDGTQLNSLVEMNETRNPLPNPYSERPQLVINPVNADPHLDIPSSHSLSHPTTTNPGSEVTGDLTTAPIHHISKVYVSNEAGPLPLSEPVATLEEVQSNSSDRPISVHFETEKLDTKHQVEETIEQDDFFVDISEFGKQRSKPRIAKKVTKPPRLSSNFRKSTILKRKESNNCDDGFPPIEIFDGPPQRSNPSENSKPEKVCKFELLDEIDLNQKVETPSSDEVLKVTNVKDTSSKMNVTRTLINLDSGLESELSSRSTSANGDHTGLGGTAWASSANTTVIRKRQSSILAGSNSGQSADNFSFSSSGDCSMVFLPQCNSTPQVPKTADAIFEEVRKKQNMKLDENENHGKNRHFERFAEPFGSNKRVPFNTHSLSANFKKSDDSLMSSGVGVGVNKERTFNFSETLTDNIENRTIMPENHNDEGSLKDMSLLNLSNTMSPSMSNEFVLNGVTEGSTDTDDISINPVEEALAAQEEQFSRKLQEKENYINELQNNLESLKLKSNSDEDYTRVLAQYEKTVSTNIQKMDEMNRKIQESENDKVELIKERDQALEDLRNVESAFSDVHRKYERAKALLTNLKVNEETLIRRDQDLIQKVQNREMKIEALKEKAQESLEQMHMDYENRIRDMEAENTKLRAQFRMMEMKLESAERDVEQKAKENAQLSTLCDELINGQVIN